ncbi:MAG: diaminopimelate epimerase, partial [Candidatus Altiarchaeota archaeon]
MQGAGNDFIVIDEWDREVVPEQGRKSFVSRICERHFGVGSDGVIFVRKSKKCDAKFHFFNPDGSLAEMCGNGIRCMAKYLYEIGLVKNPEMTVETLAGVKKLQLRFEGRKVVSVRVDMSAPQLKRREAQVSGKPDGMMVDEEVEVNGVKLKITAVGMGNPHAVIF